MSIITQQTSPATPVPEGIVSGTNLLLPPTRTTDMMASFPEEVYDLSAESHLSRLLKVLLGDAGVGQLRKHTLMSRLQAVMSSTHFYDLDRFWGALFNVKRRAAEVLDIDPYKDAATVDEWLVQHAKDASYRSRIMQLARAISFGVSPIAIELAAEAILSVDCDVYELWAQSDAGQQTYGSLSAQYATYGAMAGITYGALSTSLSPTNAGQRREFVIRPKRPLTLEEAYDVTRVLSRIKPADARFTIDYNGVTAYRGTPIAAVTADSTLWEIIASVATRPFAANDPYQVSSETHVEQPRPAFAGYQGEAWSYNNDIAAMTAYQITDDGSVSLIPPQRVVFLNGSYLDYDARLAVLPQRHVLAGRVISDGILVATPFWGNRGTLDRLYIEPGGQAFGAVSDQASLSVLYADRIPLTDLATAIAQTPGIDSIQQNPTQRFWVTPERYMDDDTYEVVEVGLVGPRRVNYLSFLASHYPFEFTVEFYNPHNGEWDPVYSGSITDSLPKTLSPGSQPTIEDGHPEHPQGGHWTKFSTRLAPTWVDRYRIRMRRITGLPPLAPARTLSSGAQEAGVELPYSLALTDLDVGYRVTTLADVPADMPIGTTADALGSSVRFDYWEASASRIIEAGQQSWKSEPQPVNYAVVNLYADVRDGAGNPQTIERFYVEPTHMGVHCSLYFSTTTDAAVAGQEEEFYAGLDWTPIPRDYVLQKGYLQLPPTAATYFKFEFTNLVAEPYESFLPMTRKVKLFPAWVVAPFEQTGYGMAEESMPAGQVAADSVNARHTYSDAISTLTALQVAGGFYAPTEALYASTPDAADRLREQSWVYGFTPWSQGSTAPKWTHVGRHDYQTVEVVQTTRVGFFVGLNALEAFRVDYSADDDRQIYDEHLNDFLGLTPGFTWNFNPNNLTAIPTFLGANSVVQSIPYRSQHDVVAVQFATQQTDPVQLLGDDDFQDPRLATYGWDNDADWHRYGDAQLIWNAADNSVKMVRRVDTITMLITGGDPVEHDPVESTFEYHLHTAEDVAAEAATHGGIESQLVNPSYKGRIVAAARVTADTDLTQPLRLQIVDATGTVLIEKTATANHGQMIEWYVVWPMSGVSQPVRVRLIQEGKSNDQWRLDTLSLFDEGIYWEFSVNGGADWYPATGIRNNDNGVLTFPNPGNALCWRATGQRDNMSISAVRVRPWYAGIANSRPSATHRGPNISTYDHEPPIQNDPMFTTWTKPVPRSWFYASRLYPILATDELPNITQFQRFYARVAADTIPTVTDVATAVTKHVRTTADSAGAGSGSAGTYATDPMFGGGFFGYQGDTSFYQGTYRSTRTVIFRRSATDSAPANDSATGTVTH